MASYIIWAIIFIILSFWLDSIILAKISTLLIFCMCLRNGIKERYLVNPYFLFLICPFSLLIYINFGSTYMMDLTVSTLNLGNINMLVFVSTLYYCPAIKKKTEYYTLRNTRLLEIHAIVFYIIGLSARFIPALASVLWVFTVPAITCALKTKKKIMIAFVIFIFAITLIIGSVSKTSMLLYCMTGIICLEKYYIKKKIDKKKIIMAAFVGVCFMFFSFTFANKERGKSDANANVEYYAKQGLEWNYSASFFMPYMYITTAWTNLQYITETRNDPSYGLWLIKPFLGYLQLKDGLDEEFEIDSYSSFNTPTYIACGYLDFGYWGSIITSLILGIFVKFIYSNYRNSNSPFDVASYVLVALGTFQMFFSNHFLMHSYPITCAILMEAYKHLIIRKRLPEKLDKEKILLVNKEIIH